MDAHRLRSVIDLLVAEHRRLEIDQKLERIQYTLEKCAAKPTSEGEERFRGAFTDLLAALRSSRVQDLVESERRIVEQIGGSRYTGWGLAERVLEIANERPFLAARAKALFADLAMDLQARQAGLVSVQAGLGFLNIGGAWRSGKNWELGILLPDRLIRGAFRNVLQELKEWEQHLKALLPLFAEGPVAVKLRSNSTERFELAVPLDRPRALAMGVIIARVYGMFQEIKVNRRRAEELEKQGYPSEIVKQVVAYGDRIVGDQLQGLKVKLVQRNVRNRAGKRREVDRKLDAGLRFIAVRVREGVDVEVVAPAFVDPIEQAVDSGADPITHHVRAALQIAQQDEAKSEVAGEARPPESEAPRLPLSKIAEGADSDKKAA